MWLQREALEYSQQFGYPAFLKQYPPDRSVSYWDTPKIAVLAVTGYYECSDDVEIGRPQTKDDILDMVEYYQQVKAVGVGHSWWKEQFCSGNDSSAINIVMTELNSTLSLCALKPHVPEHHHVVHACILVKIESLSACLVPTRLLICTVGFFHLFCMQLAEL